MFLLISAILALGAGLRFYHLGAHSLWLDEVLSVRAAQAITDQSYGIGFFDRHGPLFSYLLAFVIPAGVDEWIVRLPSAILGIVFVLVMYFIGKEVYSPRAGLLAAALTAVSPFAIWYSQETRYLSLFLLTTGLSSLFCYRFLSGPGVRSVVLYTIATALMLFSFVGGMFVVLAQNLWMVLSRPRKPTLLRWILAQAIVALLFVPWFVRAYNLDTLGSQDPGAGEFSISAMKAGYSRAPHPTHIGYAIFVFGAGHSLGPSARDLHEDLSIAPVLKHIHQVLPASLLFGVLGCVGLWNGLRRAKRGILLCMLSFLCPIFGAYAVASVSRIAFSVRYAAGAFPAFLVIIVVGLLWFLERKPAGILVLIGILSVFLFSLSNYYANLEYARDDNRGAAELLRRMRGPNETLVYGTGGVRAFKFYYRRPFLNWDQVEVVDLASDRPPADPRGGERVWVVATRPWQNPEFENFLARMRYCYSIGDQFEMPAFRITAFRPFPDGHGPRCVLRRIVPE